MSLDLLIVVVFLALTMVIGIYKGRNINSIRDYALGRRNFSTSALVATIVATLFSGSGFMVLLYQTYSHGWYQLLALFSEILSLLASAYLLVPRMEKFLGKVSIAEAMGSIYGNKVRFVTAISGSIGAAGLIAMQFRVCGTVVAYFLNIPANVAIIIAGIIVTIYSTIGGIRSVTSTDILQAFCFCVVIPFLGFTIWSHIYYTNYSISASLHDPIFNLYSLFNPAKHQFWEFAFLFLYLTIPFISSPAGFQRVSMGSNIKQVKKALIYSSIIILLINCSVAWIAFLIHTINPNIKVNNLLDFTLSNYSFVGLTGFVLVAITSFAMSTADSIINSTSILFTNDIYGLLKKDRQKDLLIAKIFSLILGVVTTVLALLQTDVISIIIITISFYIPVVVPPFLLALFGFQCERRVVLLCMITSFVMVALWKLSISYFLPFSENIIGLLVITTCSTCFLLIAHYLSRKKVKDIRFDNKSVLKDKGSKRSFSIMTYIKAINPSNKITYTTLGVYFIIATITTMYSINLKLIESHYQIIKIIYSVMLVTGMIMLIYQILPSIIRKYKIIEIFYPISIFYMLIFFSCFFVLVSKFSVLQINLFVINLIIVSLLIGWRSAILFLVIGLYAAIKSYQIFFGNTALVVEFDSPEFILIYLLLIVTVVLILFFKPKQEEEKQKNLIIKGLEKEVKYTRKELSKISEGMEVLNNEFQDREGNLEQKELYLREQLRCRNSEIHKLTNMKDEFLRNIMHESNTPMTGVLSLCEVLYSCYDKLNSIKIKQVIKDIVNSGDRLKTYVNSITDLSKLDNNHYKLKKEKVDISVLAQERTFLYKRIFADEINQQEFIFNIEEDIIANCDRYYITQTIDNLISNAVKYGNGKPITILVKDSGKDNIIFSILDRGIGIPKIELLNIFAKFSVSSRTFSPAEGRGVGLALCKSAIEAHKGSIKAGCNEGITKFSFTLPN